MPSKIVTSFLGTSTFLLSTLVFSAEPDNQLGVFYVVSGDEPLTSEAESVINRELGSLENVLLLDALDTKAKYLIEFGVSYIENLAGLNTGVLVSATVGTRFDNSMLRNLFVPEWREAALESTNHLLTGFPKTYIYYGEPGGLSARVRDIVTDIDKELIGPERDRLKRLEEFLRNQQPAN